MRFNETIVQVVAEYIYIYCIYSTLLHPALPTTVFFPSTLLPPKLSCTWVSSQQCVSALDINNICYVYGKYTYIYHIKSSYLVSLQLQVLLVVKKCSWLVVLESHKIGVFQPPNTNRGYFLQCKKEKIQKPPAPSLSVQGSGLISIASIPTPGIAGTSSATPP